MQVSVIIVGWNVKELLARCLQSIFATTNAAFEIIVIDNASIDGTVAMVHDQFPSVRLIVNSKNNGFAKAVNQGLATATGEYCFILNPDTILPKGTLAALVGYAAAHSDVSAVAPQILLSNGRPQLHSFRKNPTIASQLLILSKLDHIFPQAKSLQRYYWADFDATKEQDVPQAMGAAIFIRTAIFRELGGFDERFFIWFEDVDLCYRLQQKKYRLRYVPDIQVIHAGGQSFKKKNVLIKQWWFVRSAVQYFLKHHGTH